MRCMYLCYNELSLYLALDVLQKQSELALFFGFSNLLNVNVLVIKVGPDGRNQAVGASVCRLMPRLLSQ